MFCNFRGFFFEVMRSFITSKAVSIFQTKSMKSYSWKCNHLSICSIKVKLNVTGSFRWNLGNMTFLKIFENFDFLIIKSPDDVCMLLAWLVSSTSPSGGNQVDGLPPASSTGAAPASWKPKKCWHIYNFWGFFC